MTDEQRKLFAEILQRELGKVFEKHIEDLKNAYVSRDPPYILSCTKGEKDIRSNERKAKESTNETLETCRWKTSLVLTYAKEKN